MWRHRTVYCLSLRLYTIANVEFYDFEAYSDKQSKWNCIVNKIISSSYVKIFFYDTKSWDDSHALGGKQHACP